MATGKLRIALIAHDGQKRDMREWAEWNKKLLSGFEIFATESTGEMVAEATGLPVELLLSGPLGGDAQVGAMIARRELDVVVFFWDPLSTQPHAADVQSLIRLAVLHGVAIACNRRTADLVITSPLLDNRAARDAQRAATPKAERTR
jgi:methylglyoxal synthase